MAIRIRNIKKNVVPYSSGEKKIKYEDIHKLLKEGAIPLLPRNKSMYEATSLCTDNMQVIISRTVKDIAELMHVLPLLHKNPADEELTEYTVPAHQITKPTEQSISYIQCMFPDNNIEEINPIYYDPEHDTIANAILIVWLRSKYKKGTIEKLKKLFDTCGYFCALSEYDGTYNNETCVFTLFEPYWPDKSCIRIPEYVYHITTEENAKSIDKDGFIPRADSKKYNYPDRTYFFLTDDRIAMFNYMRSSGKLKSINDNVVIYKVKIPKDVTLYLDANTLNMNGQYVEDCVFSYIPISEKNIVSKEVMPIKGQPLRF